ncbi:MAG TPA: hypothetical protein VG710_17265 [Opitutus sp.]|nr:hypothetical protein [Opitutus sp.]
MNGAAGNSGYRTWLAAGVGGAIVVALTCLLFRSPPAPAPISAKPAPSVGIAPIDAGGDPLLREEAMLRDPTPLFLPTRWSAGAEVATEDKRREPGSSFTDFSAKFAFEGPELKLNLPAPIAIPERPADAFATDKPKRPFLGFGETDRAAPVLEARGAFIKVVAEADGRMEFAEPLVAAKPPGEAAWEPMEFLVAVDPAGVVSPPVLTRSSRVAAVDDYFQGFLTENLHIGDRLRPGFYRVAIGP